MLSCKPAVCVIEKSYEILLNSVDNGVFSIKIGKKYYYEENSGVLSSEKNHAKIRIPQSQLNKYKEYTVLFKRTIERKDYYSKFDKVQKEIFKFRPLEKNTNINIYHIGDVHYRFDLGLKCSSFFGDDLDLFIVNGDIGEVNTLDNYFAVSKFIGDVTKGEIPIVFSRGNHDTRGHLAELFTKYFPANHFDTFFKFEIGCLSGVVLDCGEDKLDTHKEYGGANEFKEFRKRELSYLKKTKLDPNKFNFAISHICPVHTTANIGNVFDIERNTYLKFNKELERMGINFMLTAHMHKAYVLEEDDNRNTLPHKYPVIVGTECHFEDDLWGTAITISDEKVIFNLTNTNHQVRPLFEMER